MCALARGLNEGRKGWRGPVGSPESVEDGGGLRSSGVKSLQPGGGIERAKRGERARGAWGLYRHIRGKESWPLWHELKEKNRRPELLFAGA